MGKLLFEMAYGWPASRTMFFVDDEEGGKVPADSRVSFGVTDGMSVRLFSRSLRVSNDAPVAVAQRKPSSPTSMT